MLVIPGEWSSLVNPKFIMNLENFVILWKVIRSFPKSLEIVRSCLEILTLHRVTAHPFDSEKVGRYIKTKLAVIAN